MCNTLKLNVVSITCADRQLIGRDRRGINTAVLGKMFSRRASGSELLLGAADGLGGTLDRDKALRVVGEKQAAFVRSADSQVPEPRLAQVFRSP